MFVAWCYLLLAALLLALSAVTSVWPVKLLLVWSGTSLIIVSSAYWLNSASIFRKRSDGSLPWFSRWLFIPFLSAVRLYNYWARKRDQVPPFQQVSNGLFLGARLTRADLPLMQKHNVRAVLDVTAEFAALDELADLSSVHYLNIPVLDHAVPTLAQFQQAVNWLAQQRRAGRKVLVHCALGRGRSVLLLAAFLLSRHNSHNAEQALALIKKVRHTAGLNRRQLKALRRFTQSYAEKSSPQVWLIANPVSGGGKWTQAEAEIIATLSPFMVLQITLTTKQRSADDIARQAVAAGCDLIIACGGDGTITAVASVLAGTNIRLGIVPLGTTNALSHALWGLNSKLMPVRSACMNIIEGHSKAIDTANCNGHLMLLLTGVGFEQKMIAAADRDSKNQLGQLAYLNGLWQAVQANHVLALCVQFDDEPEQDLHTASLVVANAAPLTTLLAQGRGAPDLQDGQLDVTWLNADSDDSSLLGLAELVLASVTTLNPNTFSQHRQARRVKVRRQDRAPLQYVIDGELFSDNTLEIEIAPASLHVMLADSLS